MTLEEKRECIANYCKQRSEDASIMPCFARGEKCPLHDFSESCWSCDSVVDRNYAILFGDSAADNSVEPVENDPVNHPAHYTSGGIECIDAIAASMTAPEYEGFLKGQVIKYVWRYRLKGKPVEDLKKAAFYLDRLIQAAEKEAV